MLSRPCHAPCPRCTANGRDKKGDNLYCYTDGHDYCFSCGYWKDSSVKSKLETIPVVGPKNLMLPSDSVKTLPAVALEWLAKYEIKQREIVDFGLLWSPRLEWLIFPIYGDTYKENLLGYQARGFSNKGSKYYTRGAFETILNYYDQMGDRGSNLILVEDMVSAIKVSRQRIVMPLFGSFLTETRGNKLKNFFKSLTFWLDYDKAKSSILQATKFKQYGFKTSIIITEKDPKEYNDEEISSIINDYDDASARTSGRILAANECSC